MDPKLLASGSDDAKGIVVFFFPLSLCRRLTLSALPVRNRNVIIQIADSSAACSIVVGVVTCQDTTELFRTQSESLFGD